jgi:hypothetical protein
MKRLIATALAVLSAGAFAQLRDTAHANVMTELRDRALNSTPAQLGLSAAEFTSRPWGVLMETGLDNGTYTLVVLADGTTSLYFSTGGGVIGAGKHRSVREAAQAMLSAASQFQARLPVATSTPLPAPTVVTFDLLSSRGKLVYSAPEQALGEHRDKLSELFHAGHAVIAAVRATEESRPRPAR